MKTDLKKSVPTYRAKAGRFDLVEVPSMAFLMIDGHGDPNSAPAYADALATLYPVAYALKFHSKRELDRDYVVPPLEALWWAQDMAVFTSARDKTQWSWTVMLMVPDWLDAEDVAAARASAAAKRHLPRVEDLRLERYVEGAAIQTLHVGSYDDEGPVLATMHEEVIPSRSLQMTGRHHEIYLSDPRRMAPDRLRTILRQPVRAT